MPTSNCYWKDPNDAINSVKTQSQTKKQKITDQKTMDYLKEKREMLKHIQQADYVNIVSIRKNLLGKALCLVFSKKCKEKQEIKFSWAIH